MQRGTGFLPYLCALLLNLAVFLREKHHLGVNYDFFIISEARQENGLTAFV